MEQTYSTKQIIIILVVLLITILVFYGITVLVKSNEKKDDTTSISEATIQYTEILVGEIFKQNEEEYYVLAYDASSDGTKYKSDVNTYMSKDNAEKIYLIDLTNAFNKNYVATESNFEGEFPIYKETTLLKITNGSISEIYEGENITTVIDNLTIIAESEE